MFFKMFFLMVFFYGSVWIWFWAWYFGFDIGGVIPVVSRCILQAICDFCVLVFSIPWVNIIPCSHAVYGLEGW